MTPPRHPRTLAVRRRSFLGGTLAVVATQAACSSDPTEPAPAARSVTAEPSGSTSSPTPRTGVLIAYFSRAGENYYYGDRIDLEVGNTEILIRILSRRLDTLGVAHDVHRIEAADPYSDDYDDTRDRNVREQDADARPEIANPFGSVDGYDVVLLASPIWNVRPPMIMQTFAESHDFAGKTVHPITTHAMSGLGSAERDYAEACRGADIGEGLAVRGEKVRDDGPSAIASWLDRITL
jgi:flavodoxin